MFFGWLTRRKHGAPPSASNTAFTQATREAKPDSWAMDLLFTGPQDIEGGPALSPDHAEQPAPAHDQTPAPKPARPPSVERQEPAITAVRPEKVRLVIWDLDETFWHGTLTEGGMIYRRDMHDAVIALAKRGIISSICSKNDFATVQSILEREGIWDYFVFPSIDWTPKGPRLAAMIEAVQLRAPTILFIDDNPMNLAEARKHVPGLQVAPETILPSLLADSRFAGKDDSDLTRLKQYQLLQRKQVESAASGDNLSFLRESNIVVSIEYDVMAHLDRAIELVNRTNQLNFTKQRLPDEIDAARAALTDLLRKHNIQAGLVSVRDDYGDYGFCGFYVSQQNIRLHHFCFSCRILNMGVETWLYNHLNRPILHVSGEVLTDVKADTRNIDWITMELAGGKRALNTGPKLDYFYGRGACDILAVSHYFGSVARQVIEEVTYIGTACVPIRAHSMCLRYALQGFSEQTLEVAKHFGYNREHFESFLSSIPPGAQGVWLLSFTTEHGTQLYRAKATGEAFPVAFTGVRRQNESLLNQDPETTGLDPNLLAIMQRELDFVGVTPDDIFIENLRMALDRATDTTHVFIMLGNELLLNGRGEPTVPEGMVHRNKLIRQVVADYPRVTTVSLENYVPSDAPISERAGYHFDRMVYFRLFEDITRRVAQASALTMEAAE